LVQELHQLVTQARELVEVQELVQELHQLVTQARELVEVQGF
jgi:hypothetical protein